MEFFKQRARQILMDVPSYGYTLEDEYSYDGKPMPLKFCYQQLKNLIKRPAGTVAQA